jgi:hypothetical protein
MPPIIMPPIIEWADITGAACIATTTTHPIVIFAEHYNPPDWP